VLPLDVTFYTGWIDGELTSLTYNDLTLSVMYEQLLEYIHCVGAAYDNERLLCRYISL
jgi:hypothetical protein